jgi:hypothetical protein
VSARNFPIKRQRAHRNAERDNPSKVKRDIAGRALGGQLGHFGLNSMELMAFR